LSKVAQGARREKKEEAGLAAEIHLGRKRRGRRCRKIEERVCRKRSMGETAAAKTFGKIRRIVEIPNLIEVRSR